MLNTPIKYINISWQLQHQNKILQSYRCLMKSFSLPLILKHEDQSSCFEKIK
jgi:hypothetical protein